MNIRSMRAALAGACCLILLLPAGRGAALAKNPGLKPDMAAQIPVKLTAPNQFGLGGDDSWLEAGQKKVPVPPRKRVIEISAPGVLDQPDTEYRLTRDVTADGTAFKIVKNDITLNLGGHKVVYAAKPSGDENYGVHISGQWQTFRVAVFNGDIIQAEPYADGAMGEKWGIPYGSGASPVYGRAVSDSEFAGLRLVYGGKDLSGFNVGGAKLDIHHNTIEDKGSVVVNRHRGLAAIEGGGKGTKVYNNFVVRARHNGIRSGLGDVSRNKIFVDSQGTNSAGIGTTCTASSNMIVGVGEHPIGFYMGGSKCDGPIDFSGNYVMVQNTKRSDEYENAGAVCARLQWGERVRVADNTFILRVDRKVNPRSWGRACMVSLSEPGLTGVFEGNLILAVAPDGDGKAAGIAVVANNMSPGLVFRRNTVVSSWGDVLLSDNYGHADGFPRFEENVFVKAVKAPGFKTILSEHAGRPSTGVFCDNRFEAGASADDVDLGFFGEALKEIVFTAKTPLKAEYPGGKPAAGAKVTVTAADGREIMSAVTDDAGRAGADAPRYMLSNRNRSMVERLAGRVLGAQNWRVELPPGKVTVTDGAGRTASAELAAGKPLTLVLR